MKKALLLTTLGSIFSLTILFGQNVFDINDPLVRYNSSAPVNSPQRPNINIEGLQKWVSTPMTGVSTGSGSYDVTSYKSYFIKIGSDRMAFRVKFPKTWADPGNENRLYPAMTFYHGAGEFACNSNNGFYNNEKQLVNGGKLFRDRVDNGQFDGFLVYPQLNTGTNNCWGTWPGASNYMPYGLISQFLDSLAKYVRLDINRVIALGLSAGGGAAWNAASGQPKYYAKAAPSAASAPGSVNFNTVALIPIWFATGGKDTNPLPSSATASYNNIRNIGGDIRFTLYPNAGHGMWGTHWSEKDFVPFMNDLHKANPMVYFQRNEFCPEDNIEARMGVTAGFHSYEWQKDGETIATRINGVNTIVNGASILNFAGNEITVRQFGTYRVRIRRTAAGDWSVFSPKPAIIKSKDVTQTPNITLAEFQSNVLPAVNGRTTVTLSLPDGYVGYQWYHADTEQLLGTAQTFEAAPGRYKAKVVEQYGCGTLFSNVYTVVSAAGAPKPDAPKNLNASILSQAAIKLDWNENPNAGVNETGFEIYRSTSPTGPFTILHLTGPNVVTWTDNNVMDKTKYYYIVRAVNLFGASANSNTASVTTPTDVRNPTPPANLQYRGSNQTSVSLRWAAGTDDGGVARYDVYANGAKLYSTPETSITVFGLDSLTNYTFVVRTVDKAGNVSQPSNQVTAFTHRQGLEYRYHTGSFDFLPDFNALTPARTGIARTIDFGPDIRTTADNYAFIWRAYIYVPFDGTYTFYTRSDDGSRLYINTNYTASATPLVDNDGLHGNQERSGTIALTRGYHSLVATFFEKTGGELMEVSWQSTAVGITKEVIPGGFYALAPQTLPPPPIAPTGVSVSQHSFNQLNISWNDIVPNETGFEIVRSNSVNGTYLPVATVAANQSFYRDSALNAGTTYHYRVRAINPGGASPFAGPANATTAAAPAAPAAPNGLVALVEGRDRISIRFNDNSSNETGFEVWRSVNNTSNYLLINTIPAASGGQVMYADTGLFANVTYYYRVRAKGLTNFSGYAGPVNGRTLNTAPVSDKPLDFGVKYSTTTEMEISATDIDGDVLNFTTLSKPSFVTVETIGNGKVKLKISPRLSNTGVYAISLRVDDGFQGYDTTFVTFTVNDNTVPTLQPVANVVVKEGEQRSIPLVGFDADGLDDLFWITTGLPAFATVDDLGNGNGMLQIRPDYSHSGTYTASVRLDDGYGSWTMRTFQITVEEKDPNEIIQANFRYFTGNVNGWNDIALPQNPNVSTPATYFNAGNLINTRGEPTPVGLTVVSGTYTSAQSGTLTGNNSGVYPDNVIRDQMTWGFFAGNNASDTVRLKAFGLDQNKVYSFIFFGSYNCVGCGNANSETRYQIQDKEAVVKFYSNTSRTDTIHGISPNENGEVIITMIGDASNNFGGVLNALVIDARFNDGTLPAKPLNLSAAFVENLGVQLEWIDRSYNESNYHIFRSKTRNGVYTQVNTTGIYIDSTRYTDKEIEPLTQYFYFVRGVNEYGDGLSSDTVSISSGNNIPGITSISDLFVKTATTAFREFTVTDDAGDQLEVFVVNNPAFITITNEGNGVHRLNFNPTANDLGAHYLTVGVRDDKGGEAFTSFNVFVADKDTRSIFVNFGAAEFPAPAPWNNFLGNKNTNVQLTNLRDENNLNTGFSIRTIQRMNGTSALGHISGNDRGIYPDAVLRASNTSNLATPTEFRFAGLNPNMRYNISVLSSVNEGTGYRVRYSSRNLTIAGDENSANQVDTLDARYNTTKSANLNGLIPNAAGEVYVLMEKLDGTIYVNAIVLEEYNPSIQVLAPVHLYVESINRSSARISWSDRSYNESAAGGFQLERALDENFQTGLTVIGLPANTSKYINTGLLPNTTYWYRVRAKAGTEFSEYSNQAKTTTPQTIVYVNFNFQVANGPTPWNNLQTSPDTESEYVNMIDQSGFNSGVKLSIEKTFNGENTAGRQVGNTGFAPDIVLASSYWIDNTQEAQMKVSGLNHSKRYRIGFFGSMSTNGWYHGNYTATYSISGRTVYLNSWNNSTKIVYIDDVRPNESGEIFLDFSTTETAAWGFNGGLLIESYDVPAGAATQTLQNQLFIGTNPDELVQGRESSVAETGAALRFYPNPFVDMINLDFNNSSSANSISVDVYDLAGRLAFRKDFGQMAAGMHSLRLNTAEAKLGSGVYLVTLHVNGRPVQASKMIRSKR